MAIFGNQWQSLAIFGNLWQLKQSKIQFFPPWLLHSCCRFTHSLTHLQCFSSISKFEKYDVFNFRKPLKVSFLHPLTLLLISPNIQSISSICRCSLIEMLHTTLITDLRLYRILPKFLFVSQLAKCVANGDRLCA